MYIPLTACQLGHVYVIRSRNLSVAVYDGANGFIGIREKFGQRYLFTEYHHDQGAPYGTVHPLKDLGPLPAGIEPIERMVHKHGDHWGRRGEEIVPVIRRDKRDDEPPHGSRQGFVDLYADTGERMPDKQYPFLRENQPLFKHLAVLEEIPSAGDDSA